MKLTLSGQLSQEFVAAYSFRLQMQGPGRRAAQAFGNSARTGQLRQIHAFQLGGNLIDWARQKLRVDLCAHFATRPFCLCVADGEL